MRCALRTSAKPRSIHTARQKQRPIIRKLSIYTIRFYSRRSHIQGHIRIFWHITYVLWCVIIGEHLAAYLNDSFLAAWSVATYMNTIFEKSTDHLRNVLINHRRCRARARARAHSDTKPPTGLPFAASRNNIQLAGRPMSTSVRPKSKFGCDSRVRERQGFPRLGNYTRNEAERSETKPKYQHTKNTTRYAETWA